MKKLSWLVPLAGLMALGCGGPEGLHASGSVVLAVHQSGQPDGAASFDLTDGRYIDTPAQSGQEVSGTCTRGTAGWSIVLTRTAGAGGLQQFRLAAPDDIAGTAATAVTFRLGSSDFQASGTQCAVTVTPSPTDHGVRLAGRCTGVQAGSDPRTVDADVNLSLWNCY